MKIVIDNNFGLCNKLWSIVNPIIWSIKNKKKILILSYDYHFKFFPNLYKNKYFINPYIGLHHSLGYRLSHKVRLNLLKAQKKYKLIENNLWNGWNCIEERLEKDDINIIKKIFIPCKKIEKKLEGIFIKKRKKYDLIVGVHIRRGDYKDFIGGKFFYSFHDYNKILHKIQRLFPYNIVFFLCSNEIIEEKAFKDFNYFTIKGGVIYDLYGLSKCDYIIGPPSTFSLWGALYGEVPISFIINKNQSNFIFKKINYCLSLEEIEKIANT